MSKLLYLFQGLGIFDNMRVVIIFIGKYQLCDSI